MCSWRRDLLSGRLERTWCVISVRCQNYQLTSNSITVKSYMCSAVDMNRIWWQKWRRRWQSNNERTTRTLLCRVPKNKKWQCVAVLGIWWGGTKTWCGFLIQIKATEFWRIIRKFLVKLEEMNCRSDSTTPRESSEAFLAGKKINCRTFSTFRKPFKLYQKILTKLTVLIHLASHRFWASGRWWCSSRSTNVWHVCGMHPNPFPVHMESEGVRVRPFSRTRDLLDRRA